MTDKKPLKEAAFCIGVHWRTLYRWTLEGKIDYIQTKNNSKIFIPESEIERVLAVKTNASRIKFVVYFIQSIDGGLIRIGMTNFLEQRFRKLQADSPVPLKILATSETVSENQMHIKFVRYKRYGEWFEPGEELMRFIEKLKSDTK